MKTRFSFVAVAALLWAIVACSVSNLVPQREVSVSATATPSFTARPTFTATSTPTATPRPSATPTQTYTPTATPIPTDTPRPTNTPLPTITRPPTLTPTITDTPPPPTATPRPTPGPTRVPTKTPIPKPTNTPPPPFTGPIVGGSVQCSGYTGVTGHIKHASGDGYPNIVVGVWSNDWQGLTSGLSGADGKYDVSLGGVPPGKFKVAVVKPETCSTRDGLPTARDCQRLSNVIEVTTTSFCTGEGAVQVPEVDFTGP
jgi:hypothetical protein